MIRNIGLQRSQILFKKYNTFWDGGLCKHIMPSLGSMKICENIDLNYLNNIFYVFVI